MVAVNVIVDQPMESCQHGVQKSGVGWTSRDLEAHAQPSHEEAHRANMSTHQPSIPNVVLRISSTLTSL
jgi:hypothetical protein